MKGPQLLRVLVLLFALAILLYKSISHFWERAIREDWLPEIEVLRKHTIVVENNSDRVVEVRAGEFKGEERIGLGQHPSRGILSPGQVLKSKIGGGIHLRYNSEPAHFNTRNIGVVIRVSRGSRDTALDDVKRGGIFQGRTFHMPNPVQISSSSYSNLERERWFWINGNQTDGYSIGEYNTRKGTPTPLYQPFSPWHTFSFADLSKEPASLWD